MAQAQRQPRFAAHLQGIARLQRLAVYVQLAARKRHISAPQRVEFECGSLDTVDAWVRATLAPAVAFACSLLRDRSLAEDVVHDCFCRLLKRADIYDLPNDGTKLLYRSITNACINRTQRARPTTGLMDGESGNRPIDRLANERSVDPGLAAEAGELESALEMGLAKLSVMQRAAIQLKSLGHSMDEIADTLGLTANNAGVLVHRARHSLALELAPYLAK